MLADTIPIYPLYALLFVDAGLSGAQISTLFLVWSAVGIVAEIPSGALADRFSRPAALVASGVLQAAGYALWIAAPGYLAFAAGFVLWGIGGACSSGALEGLVYDGLASVGAEELYPRVCARIAAVRLLSQVPAALAATLLFSVGGFAAAGWVSVACCLSAAAVATRLPDVRAGMPSKHAEGDDPASEPGYLAILRAGLAESAGSRAVRGVVVAVAVLGGLDGLEEYFPLLAEGWGVRASIVPLTVVGIPLVGAAGAVVGGRVSGVRPRTLAVLLAAAVAVFGAAVVLRRPVGVAGIALAYGMYHLVLVVSDARLQARITTSARATVTSVASLGTDLAAMALYAIWALGQPVLLVAIGLTLAASLPWLLATVSSARKDAPRRGDPGRDPSRRRGRSRGRLMGIRHDRDPSPQFLRGMWRTGRSLPARLRSAGRNDTRSNR